MAKIVERLTLPVATPGSATWLTVHRYGTPGARPKAYVQGGLHADEAPGMLAAARLVDRLDALAAEGRIVGEIVVVPAANPIGLGQRVFDGHIGRFELAGGGNFNRGYPDLVDTVAGRVADRLGPDAQANVAAIRRALADALAEHAPVTQVDALRHTLLGLAIDADIVLDLHCDTVAPVHLYLGTPLWPGAADLARHLGAAYVFLAEVSGGEPFDEACSGPWWQLAARLAGDGAPPIPPACLAATVELRGMADVSDALAGQDADALVGFLTGRGLVRGTAVAPPPLAARVGPLAGVDQVRAPASGLFVPAVALGDTVTAGAPIGTVLDPAAPGGAAPTPVTAATAGPVWSLRDRFVVEAGDVVAKVAGEAPLTGKGPHLLTA